MRRRRPRLGSAPEVHQSRGESAFAATAEAAGRALRAARAGECEVALDALVQGAQASGRSLAEVGGHDGRVGMRFGRAMGAQREAEKVFARACLRKGK